MKNRTLLGILCIVMSLLVMFIVSPVMNKLSGDTVKVLTVSEDISAGGELTADNIRVIKMNKNAVPNGAVRNIKNALGMFAKTKVYEGDVITEEKITKEANTANDVFEALNGSQVAISFTIDTFASGLSGKLQNGDIISLIVKDKNTGEAYIPNELKYVKVITTTTANGTDKDSLKTKDDGTVDVPSTVTVLASPFQACAIAGYEKGEILQAVLVYRGDKKAAEKFLNKQNEYLNGKE